MPQPLRSLVAGATVLAGLLSPLTQKAQTFTNPVRIPTSVDPVAVYVGDFNEDGRPDVIWEQQSGSSYSLNVLLARGNGVYVPGGSVALPSSTYAPACVAMDFNVDGRLDLVCTSPDYNASYGNLTVLYGKGDGTFQAPLTVPILSSSGNPTTYTPRIIAMGDLNGDGLPDLYMEDSQGSMTGILLADGQGGFRKLIPVSSGFALSNVTVADVNGDGKPDLLWQGGPVVDLGNGDGSFSTGVANLRSTYPGLGCTFHDMDGDGTLDAICGYAYTVGGGLAGGTALAIFHGNTDGTFATTPMAQKSFGDGTNEFNGFGTFEYPILVKDVNGDGVPDILATAGDGLTVLLGGPGLTFSSPRHYATSISGNVEGALQQYMSAVQDMNGDGLPDYVFSGPNGIYIAYGKGDGTFASASASEVNGILGYTTVADFNGDGIPDIVASGSPALTISLGKGDGTFAAPVALPNANGAINFSTPLSSMGAQIAHGDFNGDGKLDLLVIGSPSIYVYNEYFLAGNGDGTFQAPVLVPNTTTNYPLGANLNDGAIVDINHDGRSDVLGINPTATAGTLPVVNFALSNGDGTFRSVSTSVPDDLMANGVFYGAITLPALADFAHRGMLDAVYGSLSNVYVVKGHGDGTFDTTGVALPIPAIASWSLLGSQAIVSRDFDGDGNADVALLAGYGLPAATYPTVVTTAVWVYYGNGNGTFSAPVLAGTFDRDYTGIAASDLNGDGLPDLVVKTSGSLGGGYAVGILDAQAGRTFGPEMNYVAGTGLSSLAIADVNRDGRPDLIFANGDYNLRANSVTILMNQGSVPVAATTMTLTSSANPSNYGQPVTFTATVSATGGAIPAGIVTFTERGTVLGTGTLDANGVATFTTSSLAANDLGTSPYHLIEAGYTPSGAFASSAASLSQVVNGVPSLTALTVTPGSGTTATTFTLAATVSSGSSSYTATPTGEVVFYSSAYTGTMGNEVGYAPVINGVATLNTMGLLGGTDYVVGIYFGDAIYASSTSNYVTLTVNASPSTLTLSSSANPAVALSAVTFAVQLSSAATASLGSQPVTLTITPSGGTAPVVTMLTTNASGQASYTTTSLTVGTYTVTASYAGSAGLLSSTATPLVETMTPPPATVTTTSVVPEPSTYGQQVGFLAHVAGSNGPAGAVPTGQVEYDFCHGATYRVAVDASGNANFVSPPPGAQPEPAGSCPYSVRYLGDSNFPASVSATTPWIVLQSSSAMTLTTSAANAYATQPVMLTATVTGTPSPSLGPGGVVLPPVSATASGSVQFFANGTLLGSATITNGVASLTTTALPVGTSGVTATYAGDANLTGSSAGPVTEIVVLPDFTVVAAQPSVTIETLHKGTIGLNLASLQGFSGTVSIVCTEPYPAFLTCSAPAVALPVNGTASVTMALDTSGVPNFYGALRPDHGGPMQTRAWRSAALAMLLPLPMLCFGGGRRRLRRVLPAVLLGIAVVGMGSCSGHLPDGVAPGSYVITVTATGASSQVSTPVSHTAEFTLVVTK